MEDSEIAAAVYRHMGRLDEPLRTYAFELARAINDAAVAAERERCTKLAAWLQWCLENCDDSAEWNFGTKATGHMRALLAGGDAPMPEA